MINSCRFFFRYFMDNSNTRLFERWFHLTDVVKDLPPLIKNFHESEECRTGIPGSSSFLITAPYEPRNINLDKPINLEKFIDDHKDKLKRHPVQIYGAPNYLTKVILFGRGIYELESNDAELLIWVQPNTSAILVSKEESFEILEDTMVRSKGNMRYRLEIKEGYAISIRMEC